MKIFIICSKAFYDKIPDIKEKLEKQGHEILLPNSYDNAKAEEESWKLRKEEHAKFKKEMFIKSKEKVKNIDAVLTLNFEKNGKKNYIGGATFLELYDAFMENKKIYLYNEIPEGMLYDEISGFSPIVINGNLDMVK